MIDIEDFERKYLIALQTLQDIMNEIGLREDFYYYLVGIHAENVGDSVSYFFRELKELPIEKEPQDIFITSFVEGEQIMLEDLWFFLEGHCIKVTDFLKREEPDRMKLISLEGEAQCVYITKNNFRFQSESPVPMVDAPSQLTITMKLENDEILEFKAAETDNCRHLLHIYRKYLTPLFSI